MKLKRITLVTATALLVAAVAWLTHEIRQGPPRRPARDPRVAETSPLTDVARSRRRVRPATLPGQAPPPAPRQQPRAAAPAYVPPKNLPDPSAPPHGTQPLALPGAPAPPDPWTAPAIAQDPTRGGRTR